MEDSESKASRSDLVPEFLNQTLDWLVKNDHFPEARRLVQVVGEYLPSNHPGATDWAAHFLQKSKDYRAAAEMAEKTVGLLPGNWAAQFNYAKCLYSAGRLEEAEAAMGKVVVHCPDWLDPKIDLSVYICAQGRRDEAMAMLESLKKIIPHGAPAQKVIEFNLGWHWIRKGQFKKGMRALSVGRQLGIWGNSSHAFDRPRLQREDSVSGKKVLVVGEGGAGDEIINVRFATTLKDRGAEVFWLSQHGLSRLFRRHPAVVQSFDQPWQGLGSFAYDFWLPAMDLPTILNLDLDDLPRGPYLTADCEYFGPWRDRVRGEGLKVGLRWQGNSLYEQDLMRSIDFLDLVSATDHPHVQLFSLQRDEGADDVRRSSRVVDLSSQLTNWEETAAAISQLDLVVSTCTSVAHLSAALGKPTWLLCPVNMYYIWATPGQSSPWYPSLRLFRQDAYRDWSSVVQAIRGKLSKYRELSGGLEVSL